MHNFCPECGTALENETCPKCGYTFAPNTSENIFAHTAKKLSEFAGESGEVNMDIKGLFSQVFRKHTSAEAEEIFISGTQKTTPLLKDISTTWPKPWLFSRVLIMFLLTFLTMYICLDAFQNANALPGVVFVGAMAVPFSLIVFFMEVNAPRNISLFETVKVFFVGGGASLVLTLFLYSLVDSMNGYLGAIVTGIIEELGKLLIIIYYIRKLPQTKYVLNGLLLGAAVGAGFATFETAGYILRYGISYGTSVMYEVLWLRAVLAPGGHVIWGAIIGAAFMLVKRQAAFSFNYLLDKKFLIFTSLCVAMHAIWDMPIEIDYCLVQIAMTIAAWGIAMVLISVGLRDVSHRINKILAAEKAQAEEPVQATEPAAETAEAVPAEAPVENITV